MARGETNFSTRGVRPERFENKPPPAGEYDAKLDFGSAEVRKKDAPGTFPYLNFKIELLDTAVKEGGKNRVIFHMLFCSLKEGNNGFQMYKRADQLAGLCSALGKAYNGPIIIMRDEDDNEVEVIEPKALLKWLKAFDGDTIKLKTKVQKGTNGYSDRGVVDYFMEGAPLDEDEDEEFDEDDDLDEDEDDEDEDEVEEVEEEPVAPKRKAKAKPAAKRKR